MTIFYLPIKNYFSFLLFNIININLIIPIIFLKFIKKKMKKNFHVKKEIDLKDLCMWRWKVHDIYYYSLFYSILYTIFLIPNSIYLYITSNVTIYK